MQKKYTAIPCNADGQPVLKPSQTFGELIKLHNARSKSFVTALRPLSSGGGRYRLKIKFYYFSNSVRQFVESGYVYFTIAG
ncbi:MAG TPA: hypothetical protein VG738_16395 [Chitinophagaceae bacterium]|nr:hypothetical protein [Chitinophagaceae bacterium]